MRGVALSRRRADRVSLLPMPRRWRASGWWQHGLLDYDRLLTYGRKHVPGRWFDSATPAHDVPRFAASNVKREGCRRSTGHLAPCYHSDTTPRVEPRSP